MGVAVLARRPIVSFVAIAYLFSWSVWIAVSQLVSTAPAQFLAQTLAGFGPAVAASVVVAASGESLRTWVADMAVWRLPARWYLAALGLPVLFAGVEAAAYAVFVGPLDPAVLPGRVSLWMGSFVVALLLTGGNEEPGWRGFLQPRLQQRYSALTAAVIVGVVWTVWHLPLHVVLPELSMGPQSIALLSRIATVPLAVLLAWLYNSTDGSVVVAMLFHAGWNTSQFLVPAPMPEGAEAVDSNIAVVLWGARLVAVLVATGVVLVVYDWGSLAPTDRQTQRLTG